MVDWDEFQKRRKGRGPLEGLPKFRVPKFSLPGFKMPRPFRWKETLRVAPATPESLEEREVTPRGPD